VRRERKGRGKGEERERGTHASSKLVLILTSSSSKSSISLTSNSVPVLRSYTVKHSGGPSLRASATLPAARSEKRVVTRLSDERCWSRRAASEIEGDERERGERRRSQGRRIKSVCGRARRGRSQ